MNNNNDLNRAILAEIHILITPIVNSINLKFPIGIISYMNFLDIRLEELLFNFDPENPDSDLFNLFLEIRDLYNEISIELEKESIDSKNLIKLFPALKDIFNIIKEIKNKPIFKADTDESLKDIGNIILSDLIYQYLQKRQRVTYEAINLFRLVHHKENHPIFKWKKFKELFINPLELIQESYKWDTEEFDAYSFLYNFQSLLKSLSVYSYFLQPFLNQLEILENDSDSEENLIGEQLMIPILKYLEDDKRYETGISILPNVITDSNSELGIFLYGTGGVSKEIQLDNNWKFSFESTISSTDDFGLLLTSDNISTKSINNASIPNFDIAFGIDKTAGSEEEITLLNIAGSALIMKGYALKLKGGFDEGKFEPSVEATFKGLKFNFKNGSDDGFLAKMIPSGGSAAEFDITIGWSLEKGLHFKGVDKLELSIPLDTSKSKILDLESIDFLLKTLEEEEGALFQITTSGKVKLGPILARIDNVGIKSEISFPENQSGNLGLFDANIGFKKPDGIGVKIDAKAVSGGGYLSIEENRYAGVIALNIKAIEITAVGLITTSIPNSNKPGFSMLFSISVLFSPGITLGFGITLNGIGGLIGVHRTFKIEPLRERMLNGSINSIMFPVDPIENADRIISDLRAVFPVQKDHYVIAPFVRLKWASVIKLDIGILIEIPFKGRVVLLGSIGVILPKVEDAVVSINIDIVGDFNFAEKYIRMDGILRDSFVLDMTITGGFAFLLTWGDNPQFLFSVGGYHPRYKKPEQFPAVPRVAAVLDYGDNFSLTIEFYTAITSNSFQLGFKAEMLANFIGAEVIGYLSFDVLIYFKPFYFETDIEMGVAVSYKGVELAGIYLAFHMEGPREWIVSGSATFKFLMWELDGDFNFNWGDEPEEEEPLETIEADILLDSLTKELEKVSNWSTVLADNFSSTELLRTIDEQEEVLLLHPSGTLEIRQQALPLGKRISKHGNSEVSGSPKFSLPTVLLGGSLMGKIDTKEYFSRGQFEKLTDEEKISTPDFELMNAGLRLRSDGENEYELPEQFSSVACEMYEEVTLDFSGNLRSLSARRPILRKKNKNPKLELESETFSLAEKENYQPVEENSLNWKKDKRILNRGRRRRFHKEQLQQLYGLIQEELVFNEQEEYLVPVKNESTGVIGYVKHASFGEAKDQLVQAGNKGTYRVIREKSKVFN